MKYLAILTLLTACGAPNGAPRTDLDYKTPRLPSVNARAVEVNTVRPCALENANGDVYSVYSDGTLEFNGTPIADGTYTTQDGLGCVYSLSTAVVTNDPDCWVGTCTERTMVFPNSPDAPITWKAPNY